MKRLTDIRPQEQNANAHTARGLGMLEKSIQQDGWIGAITVAADGETFDGSARVEVGVPAGFEDAIVIRSDGSKPIIHIREDIPTASDPRAKRLGVAANRIAQADLAWDAGVLASLSQEIDLSGLFSTDELAAILDAVAVEPGGGGDEFDTTPADGSTRTQVGDLWSIGPHRLLVGDCTDPANVARLMGGERADAVITDPPYGVGKAERDAAFPERKTWEMFATFAGDGANVVVFPGVAALPPKLNILAEVFTYQWPIAWYKSNAMQFGKTGFSVLDIAWWFSCGTPAHRPNCRDVIVDPIVPSENDFGHPSPKPIDVIMPLVENFCPANGIVFDPYAGVAALLVCAHRTNRRAYLMEISPRYADVILNRASAEGLTCARVEP